MSTPVTAEPLAGNGFAAVALGDPRRSGDSFINVGLAQKAALGHAEEVSREARAALDAIKEGWCVLCCLARVTLHNRPELVVVLGFRERTVPAAKRGQAATNRAAAPKEKVGLATTATWPHRSQRKEVNQPGNGLPQRGRRLAP